MWCACCRSPFSAQAFSRLPYVRYFVRRQLTDCPVVWPVIINCRLGRVRLHDLLQIRVQTLEEQLSDVLQQQRVENQRLNSERDQAIAALQVVSCFRFCLLLRVFFEETDRRCA